MAYYYSPFRNTYKKKEGDAPCVLCDPINSNEQSVKRPDKTTVENKHYIWIINLYPKFEGHTMVVPKKHITEIGKESEEEIVAREELIVIASRTLKKLYPGAGIDVFIQTGGGSESSIPHLHWHVVPAQKDDQLRSFDKLGHFYTIEPDKEKVLLFPIEIKLARKELAKALTAVLEKETILK